MRVDRNRSKPPILSLILIAGSMLFLSLRVSLIGSNALAVDMVEEEWVQYTDPYWQFQVNYPNDWSLQPLPYWDFGFRISSPDILTDEMGNLFQGAYFSANVLQDDNQGLYTNLLQSLTGNGQFETQNIIEHDGVIWHEIMRYDHFENQLTERVLWHEGYVYRMTFAATTGNAVDWTEDKAGLLSSVRLVGAPTSFPPPNYGDLISSRLIEFPPLKGPLQAGSGKITSGGGYNNGDWHYGKDIYALDFCKDGSCVQTGRVALAPTDIVFIQTANIPTDYHFFEIRTLRNETSVKICMSLGHFYFDVTPNVGRVFQQGQRLGSLSPYGGVPHHHMGLWITDKNKSCVDGGGALLYIDDNQNSDTRLENINYPSSYQGNSTNVYRDWNVSSTLTEVLQCTASPNETTRVTSACRCPAPSPITPANNEILSNQNVTFSWNSISGCQFTGYRFRICLSLPVGIVDDCIIDEFVSGTQRTVNISAYENVDLYWGIKAENAPSGADWAERKFRIDPDSGGGVRDTCESYEEPDNDEVLLFDEPHWGPGLCAKLSVGEYHDLGEFDLNNETTSLRVGDEVEITLYDDHDLDGNSDNDRFKDDVENLGEGSENDGNLNKNEASSAIVRWEVKYPGEDCESKGNEPGLNEAMIFEDENYQDSCVVLPIGEYPTFSSFYYDGVEWNNEIDSLKVGDNVVLKIYGRSGSDWDETEGKQAFGPGENAPNLDGSDVKGDKASAAKVYYYLVPPSLYDIYNPESEGTFTVTWARVQYAENYDVEEQFNDGDWSKILDNLTDLALDRSGKGIGKWCYRIRAGHSMADGSYSEAKCTNVNPPPPPPDIPTLLEVSNPEADGMYYIEWQAAARADYYELQEQMDNGGWGTTYTGPELTAGRVEQAAGKWCYRVKSLGLGGESNWSGQKCTTVTPPIVCNPGSDGIILYEHSNFDGRCLTITVDNPSFIDQNFDNLVSSVKFAGSYAHTGWQISLYSEAGFGGSVVNFRSDDPDLSNNLPLGNDQATSVRVWHDTDDGRAIALDQTVNGTINVPSDADSYLYYGTAGQVVTIRMNKSGSNLDSYLVLFGPSWGLLASDNSSGGNDNAQIYRFKLWKTGTYRIFAQSDEGGSSGGYSLGLIADCNPATNGVVLYEGVNYSGRCITLTADDPNLANDGFNDVVSSVAFVGSYAGGSYQITLATDANYGGWGTNLRFSDANLSNNAVGQDRTSSVRIWWDSDDGRTIGVGQYLDGNIYVSSDGDMHLFNGTAGQTITIDMTRWSGNLNPYLVLYDPNWNFVAEDDNSAGNFNARIQSYTLNASGIYRIQAKSFRFFTTGNYTISVMPN